MLLTTDPRLIELKVLQNLVDRTWADGVCLAAAAGQATALGLSQRMYADLLVTLFEEGLLQTAVDELWRQLESNHRTKNFDIGAHDRTVSWLGSSPVFHQATVTYRGLRRIDELRDQLRRDRVLDRFGILLDGRYIVSDLIYWLESTNGEPVSFIFADVDDFGAFNNKYSYRVGDAVLRHAFTIARRLVGNRGEVYRFGGEEIVAILPYCDLDLSRTVAESIRGEVANGVVSFEGQDFHATLSIGVAASPPCDRDGPALEAHAENALKRAKGEGKNRVLMNI